MDRQQAKLTHIEIENMDQEKQPFFSIKQDYDKEKEQYIYKIYNTGGEVRYSDIQILPILCVMQYGNDGQVENKSFMELPGFYEYEAEDEALITFSDKWLDTIC